jgi:hypothetical protein
VSWQLLPVTSAFLYYQKDSVDNHTYHQEFLAHVKTLETYGGIGVVGVVPTFLSAKIKELADSDAIADVKNPTDAKRTIAIAAVHNEYLAALMLSSAHCERFGELRTDLKTDTPKQWTHVYLFSINGLPLRKSSLHKLLMVIPWVRRRVLKIRRRTRP